jgi:hypothetical protein
MRKYSMLLFKAIAIFLGGVTVLTGSSDHSFANFNSSETLASQWEEYQADAPKTIIELQPFRRASSVEFQVPGDQGVATLINLNPQVNAWFLLTLRWVIAGKSVSYHLENPLPKVQMLTVSADQRNGIRISVGGRDMDCVLWPDGQITILQQARRSDLPYAPLCEDRLYLRNSVSGTYTHLERVTGFLRDHVWGGEQIVGFVKQQFFRDAFIEKGRSGSVSVTPEAPVSSLNGPRPARIAEAFARRSAIPEHLGIDVGQGRSGLLMGQWYPVRDAAGMFVSVIQPAATGASNSSSDRRGVNELDSVEAIALDYLVALDLAQFDLGFAVGTDHPRVGWSERVLESVRNPKLPGPDGIASVAPLVVNGMVNPATVSLAAAAFTGGFKREHGAFRYGALAQQNHGTHYGFIEQGTVFSKLQPELATLIVNDDGAVRMKTWTAGDEPALSHIKHARQNGVPLIEYDETTGVSSPGALVNSWGPGNWSGSSDERLRTLRAGACLLETGAARFLVYGYFSTATPSAMARVFQAYGCRYAMHLDMNALEHTYFAVYTHVNGRIAVQHLIEGMAEVDRKGGEELAPRFLSFPDDRDFFYLTRKRYAP